MKVRFLFLDISIIKEDILACVNEGRGAGSVHAERGDHDSVDHEPASDPITKPVTEKAFAVEVKNPQPGRWKLSVKEL